MAYIWLGSFVAAIEALARAVLRSVVVSAVCWKKRARARLADEWAPATGPVRIQGAGMVYANVVRSTNQHQVIKTVVLLISVLVVHEFVSPKRSSEVLTHDEPVFGDVSWRPALERIWVVRTQYVDIAVGRQEPSTFPVSVSKSSTLVAANISAPAVRLSKAPSHRVVHRDQLAAATFTQHHAHCTRLKTRETHG